MEISVKNKFFTWRFVFQTWGINMKKIIDQMRESIYFNIPNLMGYLRIILLPIFLILYTRANDTFDYVIAFLVLVFSFLTDFFDGKIARKLDMVTDFGKVLDPIADKLTQAVLALAILHRYSLMLLFLIVFVIKETYMAIMGLYLIKKKKGINGAQWCGKICTAIIDSCSFILLIFTNISYFIAYVLIAFMIIATIVSFLIYIKFHSSILKKDYKNGRSGISDYK